ncbi:ABC transporter permease [Stackebrandtia nassauensis]|uniref:Inner-membrane translocator n=1 Tax=Stackebrandtia nassauensis (strain DSM 44728 / CIP 108903 / NRRL B-16338 / NBRC 102104 / LLR-40K-21) TaxID=446470 RepID=D3QAL7_STANL|nr:ABC transporter permease [Stackebrandtia nassauensis]ADD42800.1 inner-membrane translocator [Stackebrandtia nassauensis DSM 44728]
MTTTSTTAPPAAPVLTEQTWTRRFLGGSTTGPLCALLIAIAFFSTMADNFLSLNTAALVLQQVTVIGTLALGQTLIILSAGIDLSVGAVMAFGSIVMTKLAVDSGLPPVLAILAGIAVCGLFGLANGMLVTKIKLPPFIVTLGMLNVAYALTHIYSNEATITGVPATLTALGETFPVGDARVSYGSLLMLVLFAAFAVVLANTAWGRRLYATGNNFEGTRLTGVPVRRHLQSVYLVAGLVFGVAALLMVARTGVGDPKVGQTENLESITAVVLGGTSLFGGRGAVLGTLLGVLIVGVVRSGLQMMGVLPIYQILVTGILVILAVTFDQLYRRRNR